MGKYFHGTVDIWVWDKKGSFLDAYWNDNSILVLLNQAEPSIGAQSASTRIKDLIRQTIYTLQCGLIWKINWQQVLLSMIMTRRKSCTRRFAKDIVQIDALQNEINEVETDSRANFERTSRGASLTLTARWTNRPTRRPRLYATNIRMGIYLRWKNNASFRRYPFNDVRQGRLGQNKVGFLSRPSQTPGTDTCTSAFRASLPPGKPTRPCG